jgi:hypothetical protein
MLMVALAGTRFWVCLMPVTSCSRALGGGWCHLPVGLVVLTGSESLIVTPKIALTVHRVRMCRMLHCWQTVCWRHHSCI